MRKKLLILLLAIVMVLPMASCGSKEAAPEEGAADLSSASWDEIVEQAKGTKVAFYGWGGD